MSEDDEHDQRFGSDSAMIDISSDSDEHTVSAITAAIPDDSSASSDHLPPAPKSCPAQAVLNKLFKAQQKLSDNDPPLCLMQDRPPVWPEANF
ncbi:hypothetical protein P9112_012339 [Eukaryota sp. TZLM1-RC]